MQELENMVLSAISFPIPIYYRFVVDIVMAVSKKTTNFILDAFNKFHPRLQFTLELRGTRINFLDTTIIIDNNRLKLGPINRLIRVDILITGLSTRCFKKGTLFLVDRAFLLSHPDFHQKNLELVIGTLLNNDYPFKYFINNLFLF